MSASVIVAGARTPMGRLLGSLKGMSAADLGGVAIRGALDKAGVSPEQVDYVIMGHVLQADAQQLIGPQPFRLGALALGNVPRHTHPHLFGFKPLGRPHDMNDMTVLMHITVFMVMGGLAQVDALDERPAGGVIIRVHHFEGSAANHFFGPVAEHAFTGRAYR